MRRPFAALAIVCLEIEMLPASQLPVQAQTPVPAAPIPVSDAPASLPPVSNSDPWFGAVQAVGDPDASAAAGIKWTRLIFSWDTIQPNGPNDFNAADFSDEQIDGLRAQGIEVIGVTLYTPTWAARDATLGRRSVPRNVELPVND